MTSAEIGYDSFCTSGRGNRDESNDKSSHRGKGGYEDVTCALNQSTILKSLAHLLPSKLRYYHHLPYHNKMSTQPRSDSSPCQKTSQRFCSDSGDHRNHDIDLRLIPSSTSQIISSNSHDSSLDPPYLLLPNQIGSGHLRTNTELRLTRIFHRKATVEKPLQNFSLSTKLAALIFLSALVAPLNFAGVDSRDPVSDGNLSYVLLQDEGKPCFPMDSCERPDVKLFPDRADRRLKNCECDPSCPLYGDCCIDYNKVVANGTKPTMDATAFSKRSSAPTIPETNWSCNYVSGLYHVYMIDTCPRTYNVLEPALVEKCQNPDLADPTNFVPFSDRLTNYTYSNVYCALCNALAHSSIDRPHLRTERIADLLPWTSTISCDFRVSDISTDTFIRNYLAHTGSNKSPHMRYDVYGKLLTWTDVPVSGTATPTTTAQTFAHGSRSPENGKCWWKFTHPSPTASNHVNTVSGGGQGDVHQPNNGVRKCVPDVIGDCSVVHTNDINVPAIIKRQENGGQGSSPTEADLRLKCKSYTAHVWSTSRRVYKNSHCALCNGEKIQDISCYDIFSQPSPAYDQRYYYNQPRNVRSHFRLKFGWHIMGDGNVADPLRNCLPGNVWDPFAGRCSKLLYCAPGTGYAATPTSVTTTLSTESCQPVITQGSKDRALTIPPQPAPGYELDILNMEGSPMPCLTAAQRRDIISKTVPLRSSNTLPLFVLNPGTYQLIYPTTHDPRPSSILLNNVSVDARLNGLTLDGDQIYFVTPLLVPSNPSSTFLQAGQTFYVCKDVMEDMVRGVPNSDNRGKTGNGTATVSTDDHRNGNGHKETGPFYADAWRYTCKRKRIVSYLALVVSAAIYIFYAILTACRMARRPRSFIRDTGSLLTLTHVLECAALNGLLIYALFYYNTFTLPHPPHPMTTTELVASLDRNHPHTTAALFVAPQPIYPGTDGSMILTDRFGLPETDRCGESYYMSEHVTLLVKSRLSVNVIQPLLVFLIFSASFWILSFALHRFISLTAIADPPVDNYKGGMGKGAAIAKRSSPYGDDYDSVDKFEAGSRSSRYESTWVNRFVRGRPFIRFVIFQCSTWCLAFLMTALFYLTATLSLGRTRAPGISPGLGYFFNQKFASQVSRRQTSNPSLHPFATNHTPRTDDDRRLGLWDTVRSGDHNQCSCACLPPLNRFFGLTYLLPVNVITSVLALGLLLAAILLAVHQRRSTSIKVTSSVATKRRGSGPVTPSPPTYYHQPERHHHTRGGGAADEDKTSSTSASSSNRGPSTCSATDDSLLHSNNNTHHRSQAHTPNFGTGPRGSPEKFVTFRNVYFILLTLVTLVQFLLLTAASLATSTAPGLTDRSCSLYWILFVVTGNFRALLVCASRYRGKFRLGGGGRDTKGLSYVPRSISPTMTGKGDTGGHLKYTYNPLATTRSYDVSGVGTKTTAGKYYDDRTTKGASPPFYRNNDKFMELALGEDKAKLHSVRDIEVV